MCDVIKNKENNYENKVIIKKFRMKPVPPQMSLKQFMASRQVLKLYRNILRTIKLIPNEADREYMKNWAKTDFKTYKNVTDDLHIKALMAHGENSLRELQKNLGRTQ